MTEKTNFSAKVKYFKCFGEKEQGFDQIKAINLIIGRNNSGKSTLLDLIEYLVAEKFEFPDSAQHNGRLPEIVCESPLIESELRPTFREDTSRGDIPGANHWEFGKRLIGTRFTWCLNARQGQRFVKIFDCADGNRPLDGIRNREKLQEQIANSKRNSLAGKEFRRIFAERNIAPEPDTESLDVSGDGRGVTNIIQHFINKANLPSDLVEVILLEELNTVFKTDAIFTDIVCQHLETNHWEIYLEEESKGRIPLSQSGSGLKTIILVLVYIHLLPVVAKKELSQFIFGFEELENNLHPALLRRLLSYLYRQAQSHDCIFFLTTHSNVEIDLFSKNKDAQILHVTHDGKQAYSRTVQTYVENKGILDDLDVRASDLLQSNGIIWVEGPSDRIYVNRWIYFWSDGVLSEGNHYQCVFYGGRLLSHLSSEEPDLAEEGVSILRVNNNAFVLIDSDKRAHQSPLNNTKKRIIKEINDIGGEAWVTKGKEIENYIPADAIEKWQNVQHVNQVEQYENFFDYLDTIKKGVGHRFASRKSLLAEQLSPYMTRNNIADVLDLSERLEEMSSVIRKWNSI